MKPIYLQIAEGIEDDIIRGNLKEGEQAYSQLIISRELGVNPATAAKGINVLVQKGILEKQRGLSMVVAAGARDRLLAEKRNNNIHLLSLELVREARKIGMNKEAVIKLLNEIYDNGEGKEEHE
jgi:DNA-binding transcriptional regulator YhcF (GntR family)